MCVCLQYDCEKLEDLRQQLRALSQREDDAHQELHQCRQSLDMTKSSYEQKVLQLQKEKFKLDSDLEEVEKDISFGSC